MSTKEPSLRLNLNSTAIQTCIKAMFDAPRGEKTPDGFISFFTRGAHTFTVEEASWLHKILENHILFIQKDSPEYSSAMGLVGTLNDFLVSSTLVETPPVKEPEVVSPEQILDLKIKEKRDEIFRSIFMTDSKKKLNIWGQVVEQSDPVEPAPVPVPTNKMPDTFEPPLKTPFSESHGRSKLLSCDSGKTQLDLDLKMPKLTMWGSENAFSKRTSIVNPFDYPESSFCSQPTKVDQKKK